jgi:hypothetical protein
MLGSSSTIRMRGMSGPCRQPGIRSVQRKDNREATAAARQQIDEARVDEAIGTQEAEAAAAEQAEAAAARQAEGAAAWQAVDARVNEATVSARQDVVNARSALLVEVDELEAATRMALDVPAKIRRTRSSLRPVGLTFLVVGGPQRTARRVVRTLRGGRPRPPKAVLPDEIERLVADLGGDTELIRARLDREFADYLGLQKRGGRLRSGASNTFWRGANVFTTVFAANAAGRLAQRLFAGGRAGSGPLKDEDMIPSDKELDGI